MSDKNKIDDTRESTGISRLDDNTRKNLYDKFVDGGGSVIDERTKRRNLTIDREKQRNYKQKFDKHRNTQRKPAPKNRKGRSSSPVKPASAVKGNFLTKYFNKLKIRLRLKFLGVARLSGYYFNPKFLYRFNKIYKLSLMEIQILYIEIFRKNTALSKKIISRLDKAKPLYYELLYMMGNVFENSIMDKISDNYNEHPDIPTKVSELKEPLMEIYKKLYLIYRFENTISSAFNSSINLFAKVDADKTISPSSERKKMKNNIFITFHKLYPRLHLLFCFYIGEKIELGDPRIEEELNITIKDKPGMRAANQEIEEPALEMTEEKDEEKKEKEEEDNFKTKAIKNGLEMMSSLDIDKLRIEFDKSKLFENISNKDKVLLTYILFNEFDKEYSLILTTNKIKYNIDFSDRANSDFGSRLGDLYTNMRKSSDILKEYAEELSNYEKARKERPQGSSQYIEYTKRLESIEKKKNSIGKNALLSVKSFMGKVCSELATLIEDMKEAQKYILNPQESFEFEEHIEGEKKLNGKKIYQGIYIVFCFASAFESRLGPEGDLSGKLEYIEKKNNQKQRMNQTTKGSSISEKREESDEEGDKSILDELSDML